MNTAWSIDWVSGTFKQEGVTDLDVRKALSFGYKHKQWAQVNPKFGYEAAFQHPFGHLVYANVYRPEMGVHVACGGRALREMAEAGFPAPDLLKWIAEQNGKITRIDLAIDVWGVEIDPVALAKSPRVKDAPGSARKASAIENSEGGRTAYIGSRSSDKFMRVYDKANEQGLKDTLWTRFELELKGDQARHAAATMAGLPDADRPAFIKGLMRGLANFQDETYQAVMDAEAVYLETTRKTSDSTYNWMMNTVARSLAALIISRQDRDVWSEFVQQVHANMIAKGVDFNEDAETGSEGQTAGS